MSYDMEAKVQCNTPGGLVPHRYTLREKLVEQKTQIERHLANINAALKFMDENPNFEAFHDTITKAGF